MKALKPSNYSMNERSVIARKFHTKWVDVTNLQRISQVHQIHHIAFYEITPDFIKVMD